ncbi:hypothetical protein Tco_1352131 [Tanacetum coccineum]
MIIPLRIPLSTAVLRSLSTVLELPYLAVLLTFCLASTLTRMTCFPNKVSSSTVKIHRILAFVSNSTITPIALYKADDILQGVSTTHNQEKDLQWEMAMVDNQRKDGLSEEHGRQLDINGFQEIRVQRKRNNTRSIQRDSNSECLKLKNGIGGYDWSYQAEEEKPTNHALMAFTSSGSSSSSDSELLAASLAEKFCELTDNYESRNMDVTLFYTPNNNKTIEIRCLHTVRSNAVSDEHTIAPIIEEGTQMMKVYIDYTVRPNTEKIESVKTVRVERHFANKNNSINTNVNTARVKHTTARDRAVVSENKGKRANAVKASACWVWKAKNSNASTTFKKYSYVDARGRSKSIMSWILKRVLFYVQGNPQQKEYKEKGVINSGCSRHMTGNKCYLDEYKDYDGGFVSFGDGKGRISGKGKIKTGSLDFDDVHVLSSDFKLLDESQVLLRVPRKDNIYSVDLKSVVPTGDHNLWDIIVNGDLQEEPAPTGDQSGPFAPPVSKTAKQLAAKRNQERVKSILLLAIPDEYLLKFHNVPDAKSL